MATLATVATLAGCSGVTDETACTREARAGITVDVRDSVTNALVGKNSRITVSGTAADTSQTSVNDGPYGLLFEQDGTYTLSVVQSGYMPWTKSNVQITKGACHVNGVLITAKLQK
ncbi:MAG: hypothetical protein ABJE10_24135 [bacterium]